MEGLHIEQEPSEEIIKLEYTAMNKYFDVAGVTHDIREGWVNQYGATLRKIAETEPDFLKVYGEKENPTAEEFESKLQEYL